MQTLVEVWILSLFYGDDTGIHYCMAVKHLDFFHPKISLKNS